MCATCTLSRYVGAFPSLARAGAAHHGWAVPGEKRKFKYPKRDFVINKFDLKLPILSGRWGLMTPFVRFVGTRTVRCMAWVLESKTGS